MRHHPADENLAIAISNVGKNRSDFMLEAACDRAQEVVLGQTCFSLNAENFKQFIAMLDAPPRDNSGLDRLMTVMVPWRSMKQ